MGDYRSLETRVRRLERRMDHLSGPETIEPPTLRNLLQAWEGGFKALAELVGCSNARMTKFARAQDTHFPVVLAGKLSNAFEKATLLPFGEPLTVERLRQAWLREKAREEA